MRLTATLFSMLLLSLACATDGSSDGGGSNSSGASDDECGGDRGDGRLGDVCREDCDCDGGYTCYTDDYDEQCCAEQINDLDNGGWGIDCDGVQGPPPPVL